MVLIWSDEPAGGCVTSGRDAPRMDAIDSDGFSQSCLFNYQSLEITNGLAELVVGMQVKYWLLCCRWRWCADSWLVHSQSALTKVKALTRLAQTLRSPYLISDITISHQKVIASSPPLTTSLSPVKVVLASTDLVTSLSFNIKYQLKLRISCHIIEEKDHTQNLLLLWLLPSFSLTMPPSPLVRVKAVLALTELVSHSLCHFCNFPTSLDGAKVIDCHTLDAQRKGVGPPHPGSSIPSARAVLL